MTQIASNRPDLPPEIGRRRTFAIISHPDAGKTTLTEKFLLFGGAIQMAGQVRPRVRRGVRVPISCRWKRTEISVSASAMSFEYHDFRFNLWTPLATAIFPKTPIVPLTAVDAVVMVIDGARRRKPDPQTV